MKNPITPEIQRLANEAFVLAPVRPPRPYDPNEARRTNGGTLPTDGLDIRENDTVVRTREGDVIVQVRGNHIYVNDPTLIVRHIGDAYMVENPPERVTVTRNGQSGPVGRYGLAFRIGRNGESVQFHGHSQTLIDFSHRGGYDARGTIHSGRVRLGVGGGYSSFSLLGNPQAAPSTQPIEVTMSIAELQRRGGAAPQLEQTEWDRNGGFRLTYGNVNGGFQSDNGGPHTMFFNQRSNVNLVVTGNGENNRRSQTVEIRPNMSPGDINQRLQEAYRALNAPLSPPMPRREGMTP